MKYLLIIVFLLVPSLVFSLEEKTEYTDKILACIDSTNPRSITEYVCPLVIEDERAIRSYQSAVSLLFTPIDEEVRAKLEELSTKRSKDLADWTETIRIFSLSPPPEDTESAYVTRYLSGCTQAIEETLIAKQYLVTDATVLQNLPDGVDAEGCQALVGRKMKAYSDMAWMIASRALGRSFTNDYNTWMDTTKTQYSTLLDALNRYITRLQLAVKKVDARVKNPSIAPTQ